MATHKQIAANRENAKKSTGPRTLEGKSKVRLNAKRDGITGQVITLAAEDLAIFEKLKTDFIAELNPQTICERELASAIAWDTWRLNRLRAVEMNMYALGAQASENLIDCGNPQLQAALSGALTWQRESKQFALMSVYEQRLTRNIHKNMSALKALQSEREAKRKEDLAREVEIAKAKDIQGLPYKAPDRRSENGFVFSTAEVLAEANRGTVVRDASWKVFLSKDDKIRFDGAWENYKPTPPQGGPKTGLTLAAAA